MKDIRRKAALAILALIFALPAHPQFNFCFGPTILRSVPNPVFDGNIDGDNGWLNCFLYRGGNGSPDADIILQGNSFTDGSGHKWLALGVTALNDTEWDAGDSVVVLYQSGATFGEIVVSPLQNDIAPTAPAAHARPGSSKFYTSATGAPGSWTDQGNAPAWVTWGSVGTAGGGPCTAAQPGTACKWTAEIGMDLTAADIATFSKLYVDVVEIVDRAGPASNQFSWPPGLTLVDVTDTTITPAVASWGSASTSSSACTGVFVGHDDISASPNDVGGNLQAGLTSTFTAKLHNSGANANGVIAHFSHAPFGVCGLVDTCFTEFGSSNTPVSCPNGAAPPCCAGTPACIPPDTNNNAGTAVQASWTPTDADDGHQCIRVKLEATQGGTTFVNMGDFHNMWVDHSSSLSVHSRIDLTNVPPPEGGGSQRVRLLSHPKVQFAYADGSIPGVPAGTLTAQIINQFRAFRYTGKHVTVNRVRSEIWDPIGSYAFTIQHPLLPPFQTAFEQRHAKLLDRACTPETAAANCGVKNLKVSMARNRNLVGLINNLLANDPEKPSLTDWNFNMAGVKPIGRNQNQFELAVPPNNPVFTVQTNINYKGCFQASGAKLPFAILGLLSLGVFAYLVPKKKR